MGAAEGGVDQPPARGIESHSGCLGSRQTVQRPRNSWGRQGALTGSVQAIQEKR